MVLSSYEALGLLSGIPVNVKAPVAAEPEADPEAGPKVTGYGQIVRDAEGNIIDVIIPEDDEEDAEGVEEEEEPKKLKKVEAKTKVAKGKHRHPPGKSVC